MLQHRHVGLALSLIVLLAVAAGCHSTRRDLEAVARNWCMTIRASQVIPVYPLTEDLQPGDVFLVFTPVCKQADAYEKEGFLPLDDFVVRLGGLDYTKFYKAAYWDDEFAPGPNGHARSFSIRPLPGASAPAGNAEGKGAAPPATPAADVPRTYLAGVVAPRAAFPTYTFEYRHAEGLKAALPIKGIPFGMALMGAGAAKVTVGIHDAHTYGIARQDLLAALQKWWNGGSEAQKKTCQAALAIHADNAVRKNKAFLFKPKSNILYLRVVSRVYLTARMNVSLAKSEGFAAGADVGQARPFDLPTIRDGDSAATYQTMINALNGILNGNPADAAQDGAKPLTQKPGETAGHFQLRTLADRLTPGGSARLALVTSSAVTLEETFDRPLVVGYLGFDVPILEDGTLGLPVDTHGVLERSSPVEILTGGALYPWQERLVATLDALEKDIPEHSARVRRIVVVVARRIPDLKRVVEEDARKGATDEDVCDVFFELAPTYACSETTARELVNLIDLAIREEE
ncbi:MAG TPA: hypothetical protein VM238_06275 [Phycisphaerae bacterium]|nr:hypothetical protein [Phycisphaerae bacterium]